MIVEPVIARLKARVPAFSGRVRGGTDYLAVIASRSLPDAPVFAYVLYGGIAQDGTPKLARGSYIHGVRRGIKVAVVIRTTDPTGAKAVDDLEGTVEQVLTALCGWRPGAQTGVFEMTGASVGGVNNGLLILQIDFTIMDQLRFHQ
jgi:hypothetical protein